MAWKHISECLPQWLVEEVARRAIERAPAAEHWPLDDAPQGDTGGKASEPARAGCSPRDASAPAPRNAHTVVESTSPDAGTHSRMTWRCSACAAHWSIRGASDDAPACRPRDTSRSTTPQPYDVHRENENVSCGRSSNSRRTRLENGFELVGFSLGFGVRRQFPARQGLGLQLVFRRDAPLLPAVHQPAIDAKCLCCV